MTYQIKNIHKSAHLKLQKLAIYIKKSFLFHILFLMNAIIIIISQFKHYLHISTNFNYFWLCNLIQFNLIIVAFPINFNYCCYCSLKRYIYVHQLYYIVLDKKHGIEFIRPSFHMHYFETVCVCVCFTKCCTKLQIRNM